MLQGIVRTFRSWCPWCFVITLLAFLEISAPAQVFDLPSPTGPYAVGRSTFQWVDKSRLEQFSGTPGAHRELMVYVWYPAAHVGGQKAEYIPDLIRLAKL